jgi:NADPH-dependent glutamate synthase beta subunit-like oxidoreductase
VSHPCLQDAAFPTLDEGQIAELRRCAGASLERYPAGRTLFEVGDRDFKFFVHKHLVSVTVVDRKTGAGADAHAPGVVQLHLETSRPGVFAAGDVRSGSVKRFTSAVGKGAMAVQFVHEHLRGM